MSRSEASATQTGGALDATRRTHLANVLVALTPAGVVLGASLGVLVIVHV